MRNSETLTQESDFTRLIIPFEYSHLNGRTGEYRTPGGVYLQLIKGLPERYGIDPEEAKKIIKTQKRGKEKEKKMVETMGKLSIDGNKA